MYATDRFGAVSDCYVEQALDNGHFVRLRVPEKRYEACKNVEYGRVVVSFT